MCVRIKPDNISAALTFIEKSWKNYAEDYPFEVSFLSDRFDEYYKEEKRLSKLMNYSTFLAIFISCLGLFGLASFIVEKRKKEIGVRKVLGASITAILILLSKEFSYWIVIANFIAWPLAWFLTNDWLQDFAFKMNLSVWLFILSGFFAFLIAFSTVGYQAIKAAFANPVDSIKYE